MDIIIFISPSSTSRPRRFFSWRGQAPPWLELTHLQRGVWPYEPPVPEAEADLPREVPLVAVQTLGTSWFARLFRASGSRLPAATATSDFAITAAPGPLSVTTESLGTAADFPATPRGRTEFFQFLARGSVRAPWLQVAAHARVCRLDAPPHRARGPSATGNRAQQRPSGPLTPLGLSLPARSASLLNGAQLCIRDDIALFDSQSRCD